MKLKTYLEKENLSVSAFARKCGIKVQAMWRLSKCAGRIPDPENMRKIFLATDGNVSPSDFYDLPVSAEKQNSPTNSRTE